MGKRPLSEADGWENQLGIENSQGRGQRSEVLGPFPATKELILGATLAAFRPEWVSDCVRRRG